jgi:RNA polymerase sigma factor (sigma-70 family)
MLTRLSEQDLADTVRAAAGGDSQAWTRLVDQFGGLVSYVVTEFRLSAAQRDDVVAETWLRLVEHISALREPARVGAWLATTARREAIAVARDVARVRPVEAADETPDLLTPSPEDVVIGKERRVAVRAALRLLPERQRRTLELLSLDPAPSYEEVGVILQVPVGSIGPTRARALRRLRTLLEETESLASADRG